MSRTELHVTFGPKSITQTSSIGQKHHTTTTPTTYQIARAVQDVQRHAPRAALFVNAHALAWRGGPFGGVRVGSR